MTFERAEIVDIASIEAKVIDEIDHGRQPAANCVAAVKRVLAKRQVVDGFLRVRACFPMTICHRQLIQVSEKTE